MVSDMPASRRPASPPGGGGPSVAQGRAGEDRRAGRPVAGWRTFVAAGAATVAYLLVVGLRPLSAAQMIAFGDLSLVVTPLFATFACVVAYRRVTGSARYGWALIGAGTGC